MEIEQILKELYTIDPELQKHEAQLRGVLKRLLAAKPDVKIDEEFVRQLRGQLMAKASLMENQPINNFTFMKKLNFVLSGALVLALVVAGYQYTKRGQIGIPASPAELLTGKVEVEKRDNNAFGSLSLNTQGTEISARNQSGGGSDTAAPAMGFGMGGGGGGVSEKMIMPPVPQNFKYEYVGDKITLDQDQMEVFKRIRGLSSSASAANVLKQLNLGVADMGKFSQLDFQQLTIVENKDFGYGIYVSVPEGSVNIYPNYERWPNPYNNCRDEACYSSLRLKPSDMPSDENAIAMAGQFLKDHGISVENYGKPFVQDDWKIQYEQATDKTQAYVPEELSVVYPLHFGDKEVYDQGGSLTGITVGINVRVKKASSVSMLTSQKYESSAYAAETDTAKILAIAEKGGYFPYVYYAAPGSESGKEVTVKLQTPSLAYMRFWQYKENQTNELLIPTLVFPVVDPQPGMYGRKNVIVPLVKEILDDPNNPIHIMEAVPPMGR